MNIFTRRIILLGMCALIAQFSCASFATYEVIKATTISNENLPNIYYEEFPEFNFSEEIQQTEEKKSKFENKIQNFLRNRKLKKLGITEEDIKPEESFEEEIVNETEENSEKDETLQPATNEIKTTTENNNTKKQEIKNKFQINADKITYDDNEGNVYAKGNVEIISHEEKITLKADEAILDKTAQTLKLQNNVRVIKGTSEMAGEYLLVDLNEQNILMDNPTIESYSFTIKAQEGYLIANDIQMLNGTLKSSKDTEFPFQTRGFMRLNRVSEDQLIAKKQAYDVGETTKSYTINAKEIVITNYIDHNSLIIKDADVYYNNKKIAKKADIEFLSDRSDQVHELSFPEIGTLRSFGTYIGYGMVHKLPKGHTLKLMPALVYGDNTMGIGIVGRHRSQRSILEAGWATSTENLVARGSYKLANNLNLRYGRNAYIPEGFMGARRSGYAAQLEFLKSYVIEDLKINFSQGAYAGVFSDYQKEHQEDAFSTTRFRYIANVTKNFFGYKNPEQDLELNVLSLAQGAATVYGTGETHGIVRIGPMLKTKVKGWESTWAYMISGIHGETPFRFDRYRYGKSTIQMNQKFNFNDKFAIGYRAFITPKKDNPQEELLTESRFYVIFGPQDLKLALSYDFVREVAHLDFMFLVGSKTSRINFDKLTTKDIDSGNRKRDFYKNKKMIVVDDLEEI